MKSWRIERESGELIAELLNEPDAKSEARYVLLVWRKQHPGCGDELNPYWVRSPDGSRHHVIYEPPAPWTTKQILLMLGFFALALIAVWLITCAS